MRNIGTACFTITNYDDMWGSTDHSDISEISNRLVSLQALTVPPPEDDTILQALTTKPNFHIFQSDTALQNSLDMFMNMWCTGVLCFLFNPFTDWLTNKSENIVEIIPSTQAKHTQWPAYYLK